MEDADRCPQWLVVDNVLVAGGKNGEADVESSIETDNLISLYPKKVQFGIIFLIQAVGIDPQGYSEGQVPLCASNQLSFKDREVKGERILGDKREVADWPQLKEILVLFSLFESHQSIVLGFK